MPGPCGSPDRGTGAAALPLSGLVDMHFERIAVQAYSGYMPNERPVRFAFSGRQYRIVDIADRWYEGYSAPAHLDYFKVIADDSAALHPALQQPVLRLVNTDCRRKSPVMINACRAVPI